MSVMPTEERLVTLEVLLREVLRRLDAEVTPRHTEHETRLRLAEQAIVELKTRVAIVAAGAGTGAGIATSLIAYLIGG